MDLGFKALDASSQRLLWLLSSQPDLNMCGVLPLMPRRWAHMAPDTPPADIEAALAQLEAAGRVAVDEVTGEVAVARFLIDEGVITQPNSLKAAARAFSAIHSAEIRESVVEQLPDAIAELWPDGLLKTDAKEIGVLLKQPIDDGSADGIPDGVPKPINKGSGEPNGEPENLEPRSESTKNGQRSTEPTPLGESQRTSVDAALALMVDREDEASAPLEVRTDPRRRAAWRRRVMARLKAEKGPALDQLAREQPSAGAEDLVAMISRHDAPQPNHRPQSLAGARRTGVALADSRWAARCEADGPVDEDAEVASMRANLSGSLSGEQLEASTEAATLRLAQHVRNDALRSAS
jgi:hypothetical protein